MSGRLFAIGADPDRGASLRDLGYDSAAEFERHCQGPIDELNIRPQDSGVERRPFRRGATQLAAETRYGCSGQAFARLLDKLATASLPVAGREDSPGHSLRLLESEPPDQRVN